MEESVAERIRLSSERGVSRDQIRRLLVGAGWPEEQVAGYIEKTYKELQKGSLVQVHGVTKSFGAHQVLKGVDLDIKQGEIFGLIGMSGTGKTTLLNLLVGFLRPDAGDIVMAPDAKTQVSLSKNPSAIKPHVGFSTQNPSFYPKLTVRENLAHFGTLYGQSGIDLTRRVNALCDLVGLQEARNVLASQLSGGMQKRLDIACALVHDPKLLILDEPTADLDPVLRKQFWDLIRKINAKGTTILLASHFLAEIELLCSRIAILQAGKVVEMGTADELRSIYSRNYEVFLQTHSKKYEFFVQKGKRLIAKSKEDDGELVIETPFPEKVLSLIADTVPRGDLISVHISRPTLGRVFEAVVVRK